MDTPPPRQRTNDEIERALTSHLIRGTDMYAMLYGDVADHHKVIAHLQCLMIQISESPKAETRKARLDVAVRFLTEGLARVEASPEFQKIQADTVG